MPRPGRGLRKASASRVTRPRRGKEALSFNHVGAHREDLISSVSDCFPNDRRLVLHTWAGCERRVGCRVSVPPGSS